MTHRPNAGFPTIHALAAQLADDRLTGAECVGLAQMFDPRGQGEDDHEFAYRIRAAAKVCTRCPVRSPCAVVAVELGADATGVWAGEVRSAPRARGRPRNAECRTPERSTP